MGTIGGVIAIIGGVIAIGSVVLGGVALLIAVVSVINGIVLSVLWGWFMVTTFNAPPLGVAQAIGLSMIVNYLTYHHSTTSSTGSDGKFNYRWFWMDILLRPVLVLGMGWIVYQFI